MQNTDEFESQIDGQMSIVDLYEPRERLFAVHRIFARARKEMSIAEQKTFVYALSQIKFTEEATSPYVYMDKKTLAEIVGITSDPDHLSVNLKRAIGDLPKHSFIEISAQDKEFYESGTIITRITMLKNRVRVKFEPDYLKLFTGLTKDYITLWSSDIFQMTSNRTIRFYEELRQLTYDKVSVNQHGWSTRKLKEMFNIPATGKGSYMREKGGFNRSEFEQKVIDPICEELKRCKMIQLIMQPDGKYYEKVKRGNRVEGYRFYWTFTSHPGVASAEEVKQIQERVDKNPEVLKVAKDILKGERRKKKEQNPFNDFEHNEYDFDELENEIVQNM